MIIPSIVNSLPCFIENCQKTQIDFPSALNDQVLTDDIYFSRENGNSKQKENRSFKKGKL